MLEMRVGEKLFPSHRPPGRQPLHMPLSRRESICVGDMEIRAEDLPCEATGAATSLDIGEAASLILVIEGEVELSRGGKYVLLSAGEWTLANDDVSAMAERSAKIAIMKLGRDFSPQSSEHLRPFLLRRFGEASGAGRIVYLHAVGIMDMGQEVSVGGGRELAAITAHLVRVALSEATTGRPLVGMRETLRLRIRTYIERNLHDADLSIEGIATRFKCSKRNLHKVFQEDGDTLNRFLWSARLDRCRVDLTDPMLRHRSITEIAFHWGFNSSAHFSRAFRARFGVTPRELRG